MLIYISDINFLVKFATQNTEYFGVINFLVKFATQNTEYFGKEYFGVINFLIHKQPPYTTGKKQKYKNCCIHCTKLKHIIQYNYNNSKQQIKHIYYYVHILYIIKLKM